MQPSLAARLGNAALALAAPAVVFIATSPDRNYLVDFWHHLAWGRAAVEQGRIVTEEPFTCTVPGTHLQNSNWLTQVLYHYLYAWGGLDLCFLVNSLVLAAAMGLLVWLCYRASGSLRLAAALGVLSFLGLWQVMTLRPQSFSYLFFLVALALLTVAERRRRLLMLMPPLVVLWVNTHTAFPLAFVLVGVFLLAAAWDTWAERRWGFWKSPQVAALALCLVGSLAASLVNPGGWEIYDYLTRTASLSRSRRIEEWLPPGLGMVYGYALVASILLLLGAVAFSPRRPTVRELLLLAAFLPPACGAIRMIPWWFFVALPVIAAQLAAALPRHVLHEDDAQQSLPVNAAGLLVLLLLVAASVPGLDPRFSLRERLPPGDVATTGHLEAVAGHLRQSPTPQRHVFSKFEWGEYLEWTLAPAGYKVFMDGRCDIFPDAVWNEYQAINFGRSDWQALLDRYQVDALVLDAAPGDQAYNLIPQVRASKDWREVAQVGAAVLFVRSNAASPPRERGEGSIKSFTPLAHAGGSLQIR